MGTALTPQVQVGKLALQQGLLCRFDPHWLAFGPALTSTAEDIDAMAGILDRCIGEALACVRA
jgi:adenosylmethionine-8-amino-7-oxononanoate aminotransferase